MYYRWTYFFQKMKRMIRKELSLYFERNTYPMDICKKNISKFNWDSVINEQAKIMPTLYSAFVAALTSSRKEHLLVE